MMQFSFTADIILGEFFSQKRFRELDSVLRSLGQQGGIPSSRAVIEGPRN